MISELSAGQNKQDEDTHDDAMEIPEHWESLNALKKRDLVTKVMKWFSKLATKDFKKIYFK